MRQDQIQNRLRACGIDCDALLAERLEAYMALLAEWNARMDLTAVTEEDETLDRHFVDSLMALTVPGMIPAKGTAVDVGTGAGFPGLPLAMALPDVSFTLLDSLQKRVDFLGAVGEKTGLTNVTLIHARAEDAARRLELRERFDRAVARAVAPLPALCEYLLPFVRVGGEALCWKGPGLQEELAQGRRAAHLLGGSAGEAVQVQIPDRDWQHRILPVRKVQTTPKQYPRRAGMAAKAPLG